MMAHDEINTVKLQKEQTQLEYNIYEIWKTQDDNTINQLKHNETVIKSKHENMKIKIKITECRKLLILFNSFTYFVSGRSDQ